jgi:hypothetical protein
VSWLANITATVGSYLGTGQSPEELKAESDALDEQTRRLNAAKAEQLARERSQAEADEWMRQVQLNQERPESAYNLDVRGELNAAAQEGLDEGKRNITGFFSGVFDLAGSVIGPILKAIPWWLWLGAGVFVFWQFGGAIWLRSKVAKASK